MDKIKILIADVSELSIDDAKHFEYVSADVLERLTDYQIELDQKRTLGAELLLIRALKDDKNIIKSRINYQYNEYKKPFLKDFPSYHFNKSHSGVYAGVTLAEIEVGLDIEQIRPINRKIIHKTMNSLDAKKCEVMNDQEFADYFFHDWTIKESYLKTLGVGITKDLRQVIIDYTNKTVCMEGYKVGNFHSLKIADFYYLAVTYFGDKRDYTIFEVSLTQPRFH